MTNITNMLQQYEKCMTFKKTIDNFFEKVDTISSLKFITKENCGRYSIWQEL